MGGKFVPPVLGVGENVFVDFWRFRFLPGMFLTLQFITQCCKRYPTWFQNLIDIVSVICVLSLLVWLI